MNDICLKILLVGDSSVGKTTLLLKYTEDKFSESHITTIGVEYKDKEITINNRKVNLQIWDTSGQERYQSITKNFYRNADGILFVFDVTNEDTFHHIKNWLITSEDIDKDFKKMIVGNKIDLEDKIVINKEKMEKFGEKKNMKCFLTSAKDGTNVDVIFKEMAELILADKSDEEIMEEFGTKVRSLSTLSKDSQKVDIQKKKKCC